MSVKKTKSTAKKTTKRKKTGGRDFKKGQSGNPNGRPKLPEELRLIKKMTPSFVRNVISKVSRMNQEQIAEVIHEPDTSILEATIMKIYLKAMTEGDYLRLNFLLDRSIGKVKEELDVSLQPVVTYKTSMTDDGRMFQQIIEEDKQLEQARSIDQDRDN